MTLSISHPFTNLQYLSSASIRLAPLFLDEPWLLNDCPAKASEVSDPSTATGRERSKHWSIPVAPAALLDLANRWAAHLLVWQDRGLPAVTLDIKNYSGMGRPWQAENLVEMRRHNFWNEELPFANVHSACSLARSCLLGTEWCHAIRALKSQLAQENSVTVRRWKQHHSPKTTVSPHLCLSFQADTDSWTGTQQNPSSWLSCIRPPCGVSFSVNVIKRDFVIYIYILYNSLLFHLVLYSAQLSIISVTLHVPKRWP